MDPTLVHDYQKVRTEFGKHPSSLGDSVPQVTSAGGAETIEDGDDPAEQWVERDETTYSLDCIPRYAEHEANTQKFEQQNVGVQHVDGAWPAEVKTNEYVDQQRYMKRITNNAEYQSAVMNLLKNADVATQQNNTINLFEDYFEKDPLVIDDTPAEPEEFSSEPPSCRTLAVFRDPNEIKRSATHISWHPDQPNKMAVAYSILQFQQMPEKMGMNSYIWDINNPNRPDMELQPSSPLVCLEYNPRSPDHIVGGCYNGLISFWDLRKGSAPAEVSILEKSHHDPVYKVFWIQSRAGNECCSISTDGRLLWWDTRKLGDGPIDEMVLTGDDANKFGGTSLEYRSDAGATKYLVGSEQGRSLLVDRKASKDKGSQKSIKAVYGSATTHKHHGPVYSIQRNPFNLKYFLSAGDWTSRIWTEDIKVPLMTTPYSDTYLTGACWSPTRPGVFFTTKRNGTLDVWDYYYKQNVPIFTTKVGENSISSIAVQNQGRLLAVGSEEGTTSVLELSSALHDLQPNEKQVIADMFERETKREKNLEMRMIQKNREHKDKARAAATVKVEFDPEAEWDEIVQARIKEAEDAFFAKIKTSEGEEEKAAAGGEEEKTEAPAEAENEI